MNIRKIKLALTVDLLNQGNNQKPLSFAKDSMKRFEEEAGNLKDIFVIQSTALKEGIEQHSYALRYDYCTLALDLITDPLSERQFIKGFDLKPN